MRNIVLGIIIIILGSCTSGIEDKTASTQFRIPIVITSNLSQDYVLTHKAESQNGYSAIPIMGKFPFKDTIDLTINDTNFKGWDDPDWKARFGDVFFDSSWTNNDSLDVNGLELFFDYNQTIWILGGDSLVHPYYPVFLVNSTKSPKVFTGRDHTAEGRQEALSSERNEWIPLDTQKVGFEWCGNGYMVTIVNPNEFILLLMKKYKGEYRPHMRLNISNGESSMVSKHFVGHITEEQYNVLNKPK